MAMPALPARWRVEESRGKDDGRSIVGRLSLVRRVGLAMERELACFGVGERVWRCWEGSGTGVVGGVDHGFMPAGEGEHYVFSEGGDGLG